MGSTGKKPAPKGKEGSKMGPKGITEAQVLEAIKGSGGIVTTVAARLHVQWNTAKAVVNKFPEAKQAMENEKESILDMCETTLLTSIKQGNSSDAKWFLATKGRDRGYGDRLELAGAIGTYEVTDKDKEELDKAIKALIPGRHKSLDDVNEARK